MPLAPAEVAKVVMDEVAKMEVAVPDDQLSLAIGRRQNVRPASQPSGWYIDILTEARIRAPSGRVPDPLHRGAQHR